MVPRWWPAAPDVIWHIYSNLYCSSRDGGRDLPSSEESAPTMGQIPCDFQADQPNFIFQPAAPDMIWHIYSGQCCLMGDGAIHLLSSGEVLLGLGKVPCKSPGECNIPWRWQVHTFNPDQSKCAKSCQELLAEK